MELAKEKERIFVPFILFKGNFFCFISMYSVLKTLSENTYFYIEKQPSRGVLSKRCSENTLQIYRKTPMPKCDFNKVAKVLVLRTPLDGCFCTYQNLLLHALFCLLLKSSKPSPYHKRQPHKMVKHTKKIRRFLPTMEGWRLKG